MMPKGRYLAPGHLWILYTQHLLRNALVPQLFFNGGFFGSVHAAEQQPEQGPRNGACQQQLHRQRQNEIPAVGNEIMGDKLAVKAVPMPDAQNAGQRDLRDHGEGLDGEDDRNRAVAGLHHPEGEVLGHMAGDKIGAQEDEDEFRPHSLQGNEKGCIYKGAGRQHGVVKCHDVHHDPRSDGGENNGFKFGFGHKGSSCF